MNASQIRRQIVNGTFDWINDSWHIAQYYPQYFDPERYNWEQESKAVAQYCPQHFDPERYNWKEYSWAVALYCPQHFDTSRYNWADMTAVDDLRVYAPHLLLKDLTIP